MQRSGRRFCALAAWLLAAATLIGALGAHALKPRLPADQYAVLQTAISFQFFHSLGLLALGILLERLPSRRLRAAGWLLLAGVLLFSGSLYLLLAGAPRLLGVLTPLGGMALLLGWGLAGYALAVAPPVTAPGTDSR